MTDSDIEDALRRLENAILEETQMAAAEALNGIHTLQGIVEDRMRAMEDKLEGVGDMLQGFKFDERMKNITTKQATKGIARAKITVQLVIFTADNVFMVRCREHSKSKSEAK